MDGTLHTIDITSGELTPLFSTGLTNVIDLAYKIDSNEIWAVTGEAMYSIALDGSEDVKEFPQTFTERHPEESLVGIAFNPVQHTPIVLTSGVFDSTGAVVSYPTLYRFILANGTEVWQGTTNITGGTPRGGTLQCKRIVFSPSPTFAPPTLRYAMSSALVCLLLSLGLFVYMCLSNLIICFCFALSVPRLLLSLLSTVRCRLL